jgi:hypothetical protein
LQQQHDGEDEDGVDMSALLRAEMEESTQGRRRATMRGMDATVGAASRGDEMDADAVWSGLRDAIRERGLSRFASVIVSYVGELMAEMGLVGADEDALLFLKQMHPTSRQSLVSHLKDQQGAAGGVVSTEDERVLMSLWGAAGDPSALSAMPASAVMSAAPAMLAGDALAQTAGGSAAAAAEGSLAVDYSAISVDSLEEFLDDLYLDQHTNAVEALLRASSALPNGGSPTGRMDASELSIYSLPRVCRLTGLGITPDMRGGMYDILQPAGHTWRDGSTMSDESVGQLREVAGLLREAMSEPELERFELGLEQLLSVKAATLQCWWRAATAMKVARQKAGAAGGAAGASAVGLAMGGMMQAKEDAADAKTGKKKAKARAGRRRSVMKRPKKLKEGVAEDDTYLAALAAMEQMPELLSGYLDKFSTGMRKRWQKRYFSLRGTCLFYYQDEYTMQALKGRVNLQDGNIVRVGADEKHPLALALYDAEGGQALLLRAPTEQDHENWLTALHQPDWERGEGTQQAGTTTTEGRGGGEAPPTGSTPRQSKSKRAVA